MLDKGPSSGKWRAGIETCGIVLGAGILTFQFYDVIVEVLQKGTPTKRVLFVVFLAFAGFLLFNWLRPRVRILLDRIVGARAPYRVLESLHTLVIEDLKGATCRLEKAQKLEVIADGLSHVKDPIGSRNSRITVTATFTGLPHVQQSCTEEWIGSSLWITHSAHQPFPKGSVVPRVVRATLTDAFLESREDWSCEIRYPTDVLKMHLYIPASRPPSDLTVMFFPSFSLPENEVVTDDKYQIHDGRQAGGQWVKRGQAEYWACEMTVPRPPVGSRYRFVWDW